MPFDLQTSQDETPELGRSSTLQFHEVNLVWPLTKHDLQVNFIKTKDDCHDECITVGEVFACIVPQIKHPGDENGRLIYKAYSSTCVIPQQDLRKAVSCTY